MLIRTFLALLLLAGPAYAQEAPIRPDPALTPGVINPMVTQENIASTICKRGWTKTIRPPAEYTDRLKRKQLAERGYTDRNPRDFEEDHDLSLELGGHPTDPRNLWPEAYAGPYGARVKDRIETAMKRAVCAGKVSLADAQREIAADWIAAYRHWVGPLPEPARVASKPQ